jgi:hypothetical protein
VVGVPGEGNVPAILPAETYPRYLYHAHYPVGTKCDEFNTKLNNCSCSPTSMSLICNRLRGCLYHKSRVAIDFSTDPITLENALERYRWPCNINLPFSSFGRL